jgi:hypothetical protein
MSLMVSASKFEPSWQDLRQRNLLCCFVALSFIPGVLLLIFAANVWLGDVSEYFGRWVDGGWIAALLLVGIYRRRFRCPRCHQRFSDEVRLTVPRGAPTETYPCGLRLIHADREVRTSHTATQHTGSY